MGIVGREGSSGFKKHFDSPDGILKSGLGKRTSG